MANTFITPSIIARLGLAQLQNNAVLASLCSRDWDSDFRGKQGDTITIRKPAVFEAEDFDEEAGVTVQDAVEDSTTVSLNKLANVTFAVTDKQMTLDVADFSAQLLMPAMDAIIAKIDGDLRDVLQDSASETASTSANNPSKGLIDARTLLSAAKLPSSERFAVLSPEQTGIALTDDLFVSANRAGATDGLREANIGRVFGLDTYESQSFGGSNAPGVAFHKSAVTLAVRPLDAPRGIASNQVAVESYKGLSLRTTYSWNSSLKRDEISVDCLYGVAATRPEGVVIVNLDD